MEQNPHRHRNTGKAKRFQPGPDPHHSSLPRLGRPIVAIPLRAAEALAKRRSTQRLLSLAKALRTVDPELPLQHIQILFEIANEPGITANDLADHLGSSKASISRGLKSLGWDSDKKHGKLLIEYKPCPRDSRRRLYYLTRPGVDLVAFLGRL